MIGVLERKRAGAFPKTFKHPRRLGTRRQSRADATMAKGPLGRLAQPVRAPALQAGGPRFEPATAHH